MPQPFYLFNYCIKFMARNNYFLSMKHILLAALLLGSTSVMAQRVELGVGGGFCINTAPSGNLEYVSDQSLINYAGTLKLMYTSATRWQLGIDAHVFELSGKSSKSYPTYFRSPSGATSVGGDNKKLVYAKFASTYAFVGNKAFMFTEEKGYFYVGIAVGYSSARNNPILHSNNESYNGPDGGRGLALGGQLGVVKDFSPKVGFNIDVAVRYMDLHYDAEAPLILPQEKLNYSLIAIPVTVGIRYYLFRDEYRAVPRSGPVRPVGRAMY